MRGSAEYWEWIKTQAFGIKSDGCSKVLDFDKDCCYEHDLGYFYGRSPIEAYAAHLAGSEEPWSLAAKCSRSEIDAIFRNCTCAKWRWVGVRLLGWNAWRKHRKARP